MLLATASALFSGLMYFSYRRHGGQRRVEYPKWVERWYHRSGGYVFSAVTY